MAADFLEMDHYIRQVLVWNFFSMPLNGNGPVLAENTS
jgi:hypothetical protein